MSVVSTISSHDSIVPSGQTLTDQTLYNFKSSALIDSAKPILHWLADIENYPEPHDLAQFKNMIMGEIQQFEKQAKLEGVPSFMVLQARYILCSVIDEAVLTSKWDGVVKWSEASLLSLFHQDTFGGEKFFSLLER